MKTTVFLFVLIFILITNTIAEKLECYDCTELKSADSQLKCSKNETRTRKAEDDSEYQCRIWAFNGFSVNKALVPSTLCESDTLQTLMNSNFNNQFSEFSQKGRPQALCCNWNLCNANVSFAALDTPPTTVVLVNDKNYGGGAQYFNIFHFELSFKGRS